MKRSVQLLLSALLVAFLTAVVGCGSSPPSGPPASEVQKGMGAYDTAGKK